MNDTPAPCPWSDATQALNEAISTHDVRAARRALFDGADPMAIDPQRPERSPWLRLLLGQPGATAEDWWVPLDMLELCLQHGVNPNTPAAEGLKPLQVVMLGASTNALEAADLLIRFGAQVDVHVASTWFEDLEPTPSPLPGLARPSREPLQDLFWRHASPVVRKMTLAKAHWRMISAQVRRHAPWDHEGHIRARWLMAHGGSNPMIYVTDAVLMAAPEPAETAPAAPEESAVILPFSPARRRGPK